MMKKFMDRTIRFAQWVLPIWSYMAIGGITESLQPVGFNTWVGLYVCAVCGTIGAAIYRRYER
jgi:hypothetical protein